MKILVAYATRRGEVEGLADLLATDLRYLSHDVAVLPARAVTDLSYYGAVVLGAAVYDGAWHKEATEFVEKYAHELARRPVWLFAARPLTEDNLLELSQPIGGLAESAARVRAVGTKVFDARSHNPETLYQGPMPYGRRAGDWRDEQAVDRWAHEIAHELYTKLFRDIGVGQFVS